MLNAVLQLVKSTVNGLTLPGQQQPLSAQVIPPPGEPLSGVKGYITPAPSHGKRQTMPRGAGFTEVHWTVDITLDLLALPTDPDLEQVFYLASDAVLLALFAVPMPAPLTDPTTGLKTQMLAIGEDCEFEPGDWKTTASNRMILLRGRIATTVKERLQTGAYLTGGTVVP